MLADIGANPACKQNPNGAGTALTQMLQECLKDVPSDKPVEIW